MRPGLIQLQNLNRIVMKITKVFLKVSFPLNMLFSWEVFLFFHCEPSEFLQTYSRLIALKVHQRQAFRLLEMLIMEILM